ncbi:MAG: amidohydrolase [Deltaproteobacteria bacterium]|nr:amidohydrolase [Deltaproteobacteria bacterium]
MRAIDVHVHLSTPEVLERDSMRAQKETYFKTSLRAMTAAEMAEMYRRLEMKAVIFVIDKEAGSGDPFIGNDYVAKVASEHPDVFIGFASVDPWKGRTAVRELERALTELGLRGLKLQPATQAFYPNDRQFYSVYEVCAKHRVPVLIHTGHTGIGAGTPGGSGIRLRYTRPIPCIDDVAADFPELTIIGAHPSWPWQEEMLAVALHKANVYMDLSGWSPKYFAPSLIQYANTLLQDKVMFGSDFPVLSPERWLKDFEGAPFKDEVRPKILLENARRVLGLP